MASDKWIPSSTLPESGRRIDWMQSDGSVVYGGSFSGRLWFLPEGIYVYYTPQFWRYSDGK